MIHMYHIVAYLELLDLLQRQGHLTATGLIALQIILMETVEYLMIGKETDAQIVVGEAFMKGFVDRCKDDTLILRLKDLLQTLVLLLTICENIDLITL